jgi:hypothetical protein
LRWCGWPSDGYSTEWRLCAMARRRGRIHLRPPALRRLGHRPQRAQEKFALTKPFLLHPGAVAAPFLRWFRASIEQRGAPTSNLPIALKSRHRQISSLWNWMLPYFTITSKPGFSYNLQILILTPHLTP